MALGSQIKSLTVCILIFFNSNFPVIYKQLEFYFLVEIDILPTDKTKQKYYYLFPSSSPQISPLQLHFAL